MPLARHDLLLLCGIDSLVYFYSHASCEAWQTDFERMMKCTYFYSHASCEAWLSFVFVWPKIFLFLLTCLLRGMTKQSLQDVLHFFISTHMPLARHDRLIIPFYTTVDNFYSHASCEAWHRMCELYAETIQISTHMPLARHDLPPLVSPDCRK